MLIMGIDEAGRGPVIGPMVLCGLVATEDQEEELRKIKVADSKTLSPKKREELSEKIEGIATHIIILRIPAHKIDANRKKGINLNQIEAIKMAEIIDMIKPDKVYIDSPSYNSNKFMEYLSSKLEHKKVEIIAENYADKKYAVVSAASIMAKVDRDAQIKKLEQEIGEPLGVGYPHDELTIKHLEKIARENKGKMPRYVRTTWDTTKQIIKKYEQKGLVGFLQKIGKE
ncbi:MAG: ribonuclease HII [Candidatus Aenigmarchaeota archaeon]|nr:ribonuclease HII [Candidatus Aenigmarchaeota archaeon]NCS70788.1 ribonuclease HII [Candidatus Aenigmarchaeota archaeon]